MNPPTTTTADRSVPAVAALVLALLLTLVVPGGATAEAAPDGGIEARFVSLINAERASAGLPALRVAGDLRAVGRTHAARMAAGDDLHHNPSLGSDVSGWDKVGENVGRGPDLDRIHAAFMASEGHRRNVLDPEWTEVGVGVEVVDGGLWVTELFRLPTGASSPAPAPQPEAAPTDAPEEPPAEERATPAAEPEPAAEAPADAPGPAAAPEREVVDVPLLQDRVTLVLARLDAEDDARTTTRSAI